MCNDPFLSFWCACPYRTDSVVSMSSLVTVLKTVARSHFQMASNPTALEEPIQAAFVSPPGALPATVSENRLKGVDVTPLHSSSRLGHLSVISGVVQFVLPRIPNHVSVLHRKKERGRPVEMNVGRGIVGLIPYAFSDLAKYIMYNVTNVSTAYHLT